MGEPQDILGDSLDLSNLTETDLEKIQQFRVIKYYTFMTLSIFFLSIGIPGNILTIIVLKQRDMKDAVFSTYMISLCVSNILVLIWCIPISINNAVLHRIIYFTDPNFCRFYQTTACILVSSSYWHLNLISGIRLSYLLDTKKKRACLYDSPLKTIFAMVLSQTCFHTPLMLMWLEVKNKKGETVECYININSTSVYSYIEVFFQGIFTCLLLITFNVWIYCLHRSNSSGLVEGAHSTPTIRKRLLYLAMVSSAQYLISLIPLWTYPPNAHRLFDVETPVGKYYEVFGNDICILIMYTNNSTNFIVYCFFGRRFRLQFYKLVRHWTRCCPCSCSKGASTREFSTDVHLTLSSPNETDDVTSIEQSKALKEAASKNDGVIEPLKKLSESTTIEKAHRFHDRDDDPLHGIWGSDALTTSSADDGSVHMYKNAKKSMLSMSASSRLTRGTD